MEGTWRPLRRHGWSWQQPARRAIERDEHAVGLWRREVRPRVRALRRRLIAGQARHQPRGGRPRPDHPGGEAPAPADPVPP
ncbi:winged helix-turn-helix domain-containing protein [Streptomyces sp. NPDC051569]|uniref:winged helix-turn-helix domain-containing protein n=1 Tax=Streptomyces sp. NPDC051569 TaxID=3365661 RepID=UPI0037A1F3F6